jgi:hypothetical protein
MAGPKVLLSGSCRCGAVTYISSSLPIELGNCYCFTCRKLGGSAFLTFLGFLTSSITWTSGLGSLKKTSYLDVAERAHCPECGSPIYMTYYHQPERIGILAGTIGEESVRGELAKLNYHIFSKEKVKWHDLPDDGVRRLERHRPAGLVRSLHKVGVVTCAWTN